MTTARQQTGRPGFTLIELLVVIGIILVLMSIIVMGFRHVHEQGASRETSGELHVCSDLLEEYSNVNGRGNLEGPVGSTTPMPLGVLPSALPNTGASYVVYQDDPISPPVPPSPNSFIALTDLGLGVSFNGSQVTGTTDMGDKSPGLNTARYNAPAMQRTIDVMFLLLRDPKNRAIVSSIPPKRIMEGQTAMNGVQAPNDISRAVLLDGYGDPIIYVPAGGIHVTIVDPSTGNAALRTEYVVRSTGMFPAADLAKHPISAADRPFWASAGQDGDFTKGDDNIYSFDLK